MITYVNTVFVSNAGAGNNAILDSVPAANNASANKGKFIFFDVDANAYDINANTKRFKIGMITGKTLKDMKGVSHTDIKWSNIIQAADIKSLSRLNYTASTEDAVYIDFSNIAAEVVEELAKGGKRIIVRLTFKDLPTRYRKWTESYEYVTEETNVEDASAKTAFKNKIAHDIADLINKQWKRARVNVTAGTYVPASENQTTHVVTPASLTAGAGAAIKIEAMPYDDDDAVDTLNWAEKVRFNANCYWTDPAAEGWASLNKMFMKGVTIDKIPGFRYAADAKLVRDREAQAMGYEGILNRGNGTWPIVKPAMETDLTAQYAALTLEFENMYRAADDIFRKTKQAVEIYVAGGSTSIDNSGETPVESGFIKTLFDKIGLTLGKNGRSVSDEVTEDGAKDAPNA